MKQRIFFTSIFFLLSLHIYAQRPDAARMDFYDLLRLALNERDTIDGRAQPVLKIYPVLTDSVNYYNAGRNPYRLRHRNDPALKGLLDYDPLDSTYTALLVDAGLFARGLQAAGLGGGAGGGDVITSLTYNGSVLTINTNLGSFNATIDPTTLDVQTPLTIGTTTHPAGTSLRTVLESITSGGNTSTVTAIVNAPGDTTFVHDDGQGNETAWNTAGGTGNTSAITVIVNAPGDTTWSHDDGQGNLTVWNRPASAAVEAESGTYVEGTNGRVRLSGEGANFRALLEPKYIGGDDTKITFGDNEGAFQNRMIFDNSTNPLRPNLRHNIGGTTTDRTFFYFDALRGQLGTTGSVIGDESLLDWSGTDITLTQKGAATGTSVFKQQGSTIYLNSGAGTDVDRVPQAADPNSFRQTPTGTRWSIINGGEIWTPNVLAGTATNGQSLKYNSADNTVEFGDVASEYICLDTINQATHGFVAGDAVRVLGIGTYIANPTDSVPDAIVIDAIDADNAVIMYCGSIRIASLSTGAQTFWNGLNNSLYFETNTGLNHVADAEARPIIKRQAGTLLTPNFYSFGSGAGGTDVHIGNTDLSIAENTRSLTLGANTLMDFTSAQISYKMGNGPYGTAGEHGALFDLNPGSATNFTGFGVVRTGGGNNSIFFGENDAGVIYGMSFFDRSVTFQGEGTMGFEAPTVLLGSGTGTAVTTIQSVARCLPIPADDAPGEVNSGGVAANDGMILYVNTTNATFTQTGFWKREGGAWVKF